MLREQQQQPAAQDTGPDAVVKVRWDKDKEGYARGELARMFEHYGEVDVVLGGPGKALAAFRRRQDAVRAMHREKGRAANPLRFAWQFDPAGSAGGASPASSTGQRVNPYLDLGDITEEAVLAQLRRAAEAQRQQHQQQQHV